MKISLSQTEFFDVTDFNGRVYVDTEQGKGFNALLVECLTRHYKTKLTGARRMYLVIEGSGTFTINGQKETVAPMDLFVVESDDEYEYEGQMKLFEFNVPGTKEDNETRLD